MSANNPTIYKDGTKKWYKDGTLHRTDGPAIESPYGYKAWYQNGKLHRTDGPAVERADGTKYWYYNGEHIKASSQEEFIRTLKVLIFA